MTGMDDMAADRHSAGAWIASLREWLAGAPGRQSTMRWLATACALFAAMASAGWLASGAPRWDLLRDRQVRRQMLAEELVRLQVQAGDLSALQRGHDALAASLREQARALPAATEIDSLLGELHRAAPRHGVRLAVLRMEPAMSLPARAISPAVGSPVAPASPFAELPVTLRAEGGYGQITAWLGDLAAQRGAVVLRRFVLRAGADSSPLTFDGVAIVHAADGLTPGAHRRSVPTAERPRAMASDPFSPSRLDRLPSPTDGVSMVGVLRDRHRRFGIVDDNGQIRHVRVGDALGRHGGRVVSVDDDTVAWRERNGEGRQSGEDGQGAGQWINRCVKLAAPHGA